MSEPWSLVHVHGLFNTKQLSMPEYQRLLRSVVRLQCKKEHKREVEHVFIKTTMFMAPAFPLLMEMFPKAKYIFNTRQWVPSVESYMQLAQFVPLLVYYTGVQFQVGTTLSQCVCLGSSLITSNPSSGGGIFKYPTTTPSSTKCTGTGTLTRVPIPHNPSNWHLDLLPR